MRYDTVRAGWRWNSTVRTRMMSVVMLSLCRWRGWGNETVMGASKCGKLHTVGHEQPVCHFSSPYLELCDLDYRCSFKCRYNNTDTLHSALEVERLF